MPKTKPTKVTKPSYLYFNKASYAWKASVNYRQEPTLYKVGRGEQGVLICGPYKSEILPHWKFKTPEVAEKSSKIIYEMFQAYLKNNDFVGADLARKFLQMGFTRAKRYANYRGGKKYDKENSYRPLEKGTGDPLKSVCASIFYKLWKKAEEDPCYASQKKQWRKLYG